MSKTRESRLWQWLGKTARVHFREALHMNRVENSVSRGMPDVEGCLKVDGEGRQFWIELKCEARPSDPKTKIKPRFEPQQVPWLHKRWRAGGRCFILLQVGSGHSAGRYLIQGNLTGSLARGWTEDKLKSLASCDPKGAAEDIVLAAATSQF